MFKHKKITALLFSLVFCFSLLIFATPALAEFKPLTNPLKLAGGEKVSSTEELAARIVKAALGLVGILSLIFFIWGGFLWMTAGGNETRVTQGRDTLIWAALGLAAIFISYAVLSVLIDTLTKGVYG